MTGQPVAINTHLHQAIRQLLLAARTQVRQTVNTTMVQTYWLIGQKIVEDGQGGHKRAAYGKQVLPELARRLGEEFGSGFSVQSLSNYRQFYLTFPNFSALRRNLTWTHYKSLLRIPSPQARDWYATEAAEQGWSVRALDRQIATLYYERLLSTQDQSKALVKTEAAQQIAKDASPVRVFDQHHRQEGDNPTLGLILCSERNAAVAKYSLLADKPQLFASKYQAIMPTEAELQAELERDRALLELNQP